MSPAELFWLRVSRKAATMHPRAAAAYLRALEVLRASLGTAEFEALIASGAIDRYLSTALGDENLDRALAGFRAQLQAMVAEAVVYFGRDAPGRPAIAFDVLSPRVVEAVRALDTKVMTALKADIREGVRAFVENGLRDGANPRETAREIRSFVGLAPNQVEAVANFRRMLEAGDREALTRELRDRRFDRTLEKALGPNGSGLSHDQVDRMTEAYRRRMIAFHAETLSRTATLDSMKAGQRLSWERAIEMGIIDRRSLTRTWVTVGDRRVRPEHEFMDGEEVPFDEPYSNGQMIPGETEYNCRCIERIAARTSLLDLDAILRLEDLKAGGPGGSGGGRDPLVVTKSKILPAVLQREAQIVSKATEWHTAWDPVSGQRVMNKSSGDPERVHFTPSERALLKDTVMTHNHPSGATFSPADLVLASKADVAMLRAVGKEFGYAITRPAGGWNAADIDRVLAEFAERRRLRGVTANEAHRRWTELLGQIGVSYSRWRR